MTKIKMSKYYFEHDFLEFEEIIRQYPHIQKFYKKGDMISSQSDTLKYGYYIKKGIMKLSIGHNCGNEKMIALFGPGSLFPLGISHHYYELEYSMSEIAFSDVDAYEFDYMQIRKMFLDHKELALRMMEHYCDFTSFLFFDISSLSYDDSKSKVCTILCALSDTSLNDGGLLNISQNDIASLSGISKIQVARAYQYLKEENVIETHRSKVKIKDRIKLEQLCSINIEDY